VQKLKQSFQNRTDRPQFINLELSTARFRLNPNEELVLFYEPGKIQDALGATLRTEFIINGDQLELVVWTHEDQMFFSDGRPAPQDFDHA
jgi:hypothetical protein